MVDLIAKQKKSTQLNDGDMRVLYKYASHYPGRMALLQYSEECTTFNNDENKTDNQKDLFFTESQVNEL